MLMNTLALIFNTVVVMISIAVAVLSLFGLNTIINIFNDFMLKKFSKSWYSRNIAKNNLSHMLKIGFAEFFKKEKRKERRRRTPFRRREMLIPKILLIIPSDSFSIIQGKFPNIVLSLMEYEGLYKENRRSLKKLLKIGTERRIRETLNPAKERKKVFKILKRLGFKFYAKNDGIVVTDCRFPIRLSYDRRNHFIRVIECLAFLVKDELYLKEWYVEYIYREEVLPHRCSFSVEDKQVYIKITNIMIIHDANTYEIGTSKKVISLPE